MSDEYSREDTAKMQSALRAVASALPYPISSEPTKALKSYCSAVVKVDSKILVKYGEEVLLAEAEALKFVKEKAEIPAPEALGARAEFNCSFIIMEWAQGESLEDLWPSMNSNIKQQIIGELRERFAQLMAISGAMHRRNWQKWAP